MKIRSAFLLLVLLFMVFGMGTSIAAADTLDTREDVDLFKPWTITFNKEISFENVSQFVYVTDDKGNKLENVVFDQIYSNDLIVHPPKDGYDENQNYTLHIKQGMQAGDGSVLKEDVTMPFVSREKEGEVKNEQGDYIKIKSIQPNPSAEYLLKTGQKHEFEAEVEYGLFSSEKAIISFNLTAPEKIGHSVDGNTFKIDEAAIKKGSGTVTLKGTFSPYNLSTYHTILSLDRFTARVYFDMIDPESYDYKLAMTLRSPAVLADERAYPAFDVLSLNPDEDFYIDFGKAQDQVEDQIESLVEKIYIKRASGETEEFTIDSLKWSTNNYQYDMLQIKVKEEKNLQLGDQVFADITNNGHGEPVTVRGEVYYPVYPVDLAPNQDINDGVNQLTYVNQFQVGFAEGDYKIEPGNFGPMTRPVYKDTYGIQVMDVKRDGFLEVSFLVKNLSQKPFSIHNENFHFTYYSIGAINVSDSHIIKGAGELKPGQERKIVVRAYHPDASMFDSNIEGDYVSYSFDRPAFNPLISDTKPYDWDENRAVYGLFSINHVEDIKYQVIDVDAAVGSFGQFKNDENFLIATFRIANGSNRNKAISIVETFSSMINSETITSNPITLDTLSILNQDLTIPANEFIDIHVPVTYSLDPEESLGIGIRLDSGEELYAEEIERYYPWAEKN